MVPSQAAGVKDLQDNLECIDASGQACLSLVRNARQQVLTQLGYETNDYVMRTPNTGTKNDPFVIPTDGKQQQQMFNYLGNSIGRIQDPNALVYLKMPNGSTQAFNPIQLQGLITK